MECPECGAIFFAASASSVEEPDGSITGGVECPECGAFLSDDELEEDEEG
jgi:predicted  nucleic acid-binding Zn-ribbon protein